MYFLELVLLLATILIQKECFAGDGSIELQNGMNLIKEYNVHDQCMAQPGYFHLHHFSLAFFLQEHQICGGGPDGMDGLLICYRSQLDKSGLLPMGLQSTRQFDLRNVAGNVVAKRCQELAGPDWHGILINTKDQRNFVLRLSTTNRTFTIDGGKHALNELFFKLASAKDGGESFLSKSFDPYRDFMKWNNDHFGEAEEAHNRIRLRHEDNEKLKALFMERQPMQERLQNYSGIWSVGLDMLPRKEGIDHFDLYVNKSKCCKDIKIFFNLPTAQKPEQTVTNKVNHKAGLIEKIVTIYEHFIVILDGIINPDAKRLIFEINDQLEDPESKSNGMRFIVDFEKNSVIFEKKENDWTTPAPGEIEIENHFAQGAPFHLEVILRKNGITINVNCNGQVYMNLNTGDEIAFENRHLINITGDYKYWNFNYENVPEKSWSVEEGLYGKNNGGIMIKGKIGEDAQKFTIKLWHQKDDGIYEAILELEVSIEPKYYKLLIGPNNKEHETKVLSHSYNAGSQFEAIFKFNVHADKTDIWMDNSLIGTLHIDLVDVPANIVNLIEIIGDVSAEMTKLRKSWVNCTYEMSSKMQNSLKIVAKMLPRESDQEFYIQFFTGQNFFHLQLYFLMNDSSTELIISEKISLGKEEQQFDKTFPLSIKKGEIFHLDIHYKSASELEVFVNEKPEIVFNAFKYLNETTFVKIADNHGDMKEGNFGEDLIIMEMSMTNCSDT